SSAASDVYKRQVVDRTFVLTIDRAYFDLTGGLERWLYRIVRKHGGQQEGGWSFDVPHLHLKSGALSPLKQFAFELRAIVQRQSLPGYALAIERAFGRERLTFAPVPADPFEKAARVMGLAVDNRP
uniref:replication initiator protein A n=1 Tax=Novosphingobium sp. CCH12-A3 TaxID=1768752 RepID=UPI000A62DCD9